MPKKIEGFIVAVTTPFTKDNTIDLKAFSRHLSFLEINRVDGILVCGTTGEFFSLTVDEKIKLLQTARNSFTGTVIFNVAGEALQVSKELAVSAENIGADAILSLPPYYLANAPMEGIVNYMNAISDSVKIPFYLYNFPRHTQNNFTATMLQKIKHEGIKDSLRDYSLIPYTSNYLVGGDSVIAAAYSKGAKGFISVQGNYRPEVLSSLKEALIHKDNNQIKKYQGEAAGISKACNGKNQISLVKYAIDKIIGNYPAILRAPLVQASKEEKSGIFLQ